MTAFPACLAVTFKKTGPGERVTANALKTNLPGDKPCTSIDHVFSGGMIFPGLAKLLILIRRKNQLFPIAADLVVFQIHHKRFQKAVEIHQ